MKLLLGLVANLIIIGGLCFVVFAFIGFLKPSLVNTKHKLVLKYGPRGVAIIVAVIGFAIFLLGFLLQKLSLFF
jgi:hypothetical protein